MDWVRGQMIGRGSFGTVNLAIPKSNTTSLFVVKTTESNTSFSLQNEREILSKLSQNHPNIITYLGDSLSFEKGTQFYNLFLEYATKGSLFDQLKVKGGKFELPNVKLYTNSILKGLSYIHLNGFVHCDIKLQNILLFENGLAKIADFGLAKRVSDESLTQLRGTPLYMSPEILTGGKVAPAADIWALGCAVIEMFSGKPAWEFSPESDVSALLYRIVVGGESPRIPGDMCEEGKDFLEKCFIKNPNDRWTAQMLLDHPFVYGLNNDNDNDNDGEVTKLPSCSPRCPFEFPDWQSSSGSETGLVSSFGFSEDSWGSSWSSGLGQLEEGLVSNGVPNWSDSDSWVSVR